MLSAAVGVVVAVAVAGALLASRPPARAAEAARLLVRRSGLLVWGYGPAAVAVAVLALLGHGPGDAAMLVTVGGLLVLTAVLGTVFVARLPRADG